MIKTTIIYGYEMEKTGKKRKVEETETSYLDIPDNNGEQLLCYSTENENEEELKKSKMLQPTIHNRKSYL